MHTMYLVRHEGMQPWASFEAIAASMRDVQCIWDRKHPLCMRDGVVPAETRARIYAAISRRVGRELNPNNRTDKSSAIKFIAEGLPNSKSGGQRVATENAAKSLREPETLSCDQVAWLCMATGVSLDYLRGETESPEATFEVGDAAELSRLYDGLSYERRRALWAVASALIEQEENELIARRGSDWEPFPEDIKTINDLAAHPEFSRPREDDDGRL